MIRGIVGPNRQPLVRLSLRGPKGQEETIEALLDTGFNGPLALPESVVQAMELTPRQGTEVMLADGTRYSIPNYRGRIQWEGIERPVRVLAMGDQPIVGMALLVGYRICIDMIDGGEVTATSF